jgi:hypothetical protein
VSEHLLAHIDENFPGKGVVDHRLPAGLFKNLVCEETAFLLHVVDSLRL